MGAPYLEALRAELCAHRWLWQPETVYLGGGTPSNIAPDDLRALLALVPGRPWVEATMEAAPGSITAAKARAWAESGINRVSFGVQSFVEGEIRRTGRKHTAETVASDLALLRAAGIANCNLDLIAGLAGQTESSWRESLDWIARLNPPHVSVYMLEVDEDSRLGKEMLLGGVRYGAADAPSDDRTAGFYEMAVERLVSLGIPRYEISNFARPGYESRHNLKYWKLEPYAGFGSRCALVRWTSALAESGEPGRLPRACRRRIHRRQSGRRALLRRTAVERGHRSQRDGAPPIRSADSPLS